MTCGTFSSYIRERGDSRAVVLRISLLGKTLKTVREKYGYLILLYLVYLKICQQVTGWGEPEVSFPIIKGRGCRMKKMIKTLVNLGLSL